MDVKQILSIVMLLVVAPVSLAIGAIVTFDTTGSIDTESGRDYTTNQTVNSTFENTASVPDNWENLTEPITVSLTSNAWNSSGYVTVTRTDNADNTENGIFYQALTLSTTRDGISSATTSFEYRVIDNENAGTINIVARLGDGVENFTLFDENVTGSESASWTSVENNILDNITTTGTYTLWLRAEINPVHTNASANDTDTTSCIVGFDNALITVQTYGMGYTENVVADVEAQTATGFSLGSLLPLVIAAVALITVIVIGFVGLIGTSSRRRR